MSSREEKIDRAIDSARRALAIYGIPGGRRPGWPYRQGIREMAEKVLRAALKAKDELRKKAAR